MSQEITRPVEAISEEEVTVTWEAGGLTFTELGRFEYENCAFTAGKVEGHAIDTMYLAWESWRNPHITSDLQSNELLLLRPDECAAIISCLSLALQKVLDAGDEGDQN